MTHNKSALNQYEMFVRSTLVPEVFLDFSPHEMEKSRKPLGPGYVRSFVYLENCLEKFVLISTIEKDTPAFNCRLNWQKHGSSYYRRSKLYRAAIVLSVKYEGKNSIQNLSLIAHF